jgi:hypothetical protein
MSQTVPDQHWPKERYYNSEEQQGTKNHAAGSGTSHYDTLTARMLRDTHTHYPVHHVHPFSSVRDDIPVLSYARVIQINKNSHQVPPSLLPDPQLYLVA